MRFARGDMRDHIVSHKNDHGASYGRYRVLRWRSQLKISFCEIFGPARFSTFATLYAINGLMHQVRVPFVATKTDASCEQTLQPRRVIDCTSIVSVSTSSEAT